METAAQNEELTTPKTLDKKAPRTGSYGRFLSNKSSFSADDYRRPQVAATSCPACCPAYPAVQVCQRCQAFLGFRDALHWRVRSAAARPVRGGLVAGAHAWAPAQYAADQERDGELVRFAVHALREQVAAPVLVLRGGLAPQDAAEDLRGARSGPESHPGVYGPARPHDVAPHLDCGSAEAKRHCPFVGCRDSRAG